MKADNFDTPTNPYHYVLHCIGGKWKMTILHEIYTYGSIRFNQTLKILPISEKVFSQQLKELVEAGILDYLMDSFVRAVIHYDEDDSALNSIDRRLVYFISSNYKDAYHYHARGKTDTEKLYLRLLLVTDFICGMTDSYAKRLYQELKAIL